MSTDSEQNDGRAMEWSLRLMKIGFIVMIAYRLIDPLFKNGAEYEQMDLLMMTIIGTIFFASTLCAAFDSILAVVMMTVCILIGSVVLVWLAKLTVGFALSLMILFVVVLVLLFVFPSLIMLIVLL